MPAVNQHEYLVARLCFGLLCMQDEKGLKEHFCQVYPTLEINKILVPNPDLAGSRSRKGIPNYTKLRKEISIVLCTGLQEKNVSA